MKPRPVRPHNIRRFCPHLEGLEDRLLLSFNWEVDYDVGQSPTSVALGDFRNLHQLDMVVANSGSDFLSVLLNNGDGTFTTHSVYGVRATDVVVGDFNNDGNLDVVAADSETGQLLFLAGNGDGTFQPGVPVDGGPSPGRMVAGHFHSNAQLDLAVVNPDANAVNILPGNGDGTFQAPVSYGGLDHPLAIAAGDLTNDGLPDLVVTNGGSDHLSLLMNNGDGSFAFGHTIRAGQDIRSVVVGDFNHDGNLDIASTNNIPRPNLCVELGNGDGTFRQDLRHFFLQPSLAMAEADFSLSGNLDLVEPHWDRPGNGGVKLVPGHGDGTFGDGGSFHVGDNPMWIVTGDLNGDGYPDIVTANHDSNNVSVLINAADWGTPPAAPAFPRGVLPPATSAAGIGPNGGPALPAATAADPSPVADGSAFAAAAPGAPSTGPAFIADPGQLTPTAPLPPSGWASLIDEVLASPF